MGTAVFTRNADGIPVPGRSRGAHATQAEPRRRRRSLALRREARREHEIVPRRQVARWIGRARLADEGEGLTAATPEVARALVARTAGLGHPGLAAEGVECRRVVPDGVERAIAHVLERERLDRRRLV